MISNCGHDERGKYAGGTAGDQTGTEWEVRSWYRYTGGWVYMIRHPNRSVGQLIADLAKEAAQNNKIGYDQNERYTFWQRLAAASYRPSRITANCEADCSSGCAAIAKAAGYLLNDSKLKNISIYAYTGNIAAVLQNAGFTLYADSKYLTSDAYLLPGDFLLKPGYHICTNLDTGSKAASQDEWKAIGTATCTDDGVNVRYTAGGTIIGQVNAGNRFEIDGKTSGGWTHVKVAGIGIGWIATQYVKIDGTAGAPNKTPKWVGRSTTDDLNVRTGPGVSYPNLSSWPKLNKDNLVDVCDTVKAGDGSLWYYVRIAAKYYGYVSATYISR